MGAYFQRQFAEPSSCGKIFHLNFDMKKFLEHSYFLNEQANYCYRYIKENSPVVVRTVCDYDHQDGRVKNLWGKGQEVKTPKNNELLLTGYIICSLRNEYIDLSYFAEQAKEKDLLICPLALLTRRFAKKMGGGDYDSSKLKSPFIGKWYDKELHFSDDKPTAMNDISEHLCFDFDEAW